MKYELRRQPVERTDGLGVNHVTYTVGTGSVLFAI